MTTTVWLALLLACGGTPSPTTDEARGEAATAPVDVEQVAALAKKIRSDPSSAATVLSDAQMTDADLQAAMYRIARDPALSARYRELSR